MQTLINTENRNAHTEQEIFRIIFKDNQFGVVVTVLCVFKIEMLKYYFNAGNPYLPRCRYYHSYVRFVTCFDFILYNII